MQIILNGRLHLQSSAQMESAPAITEHILFTIHQGGNVPLLNTFIESIKLLVRS